MSKPIVLIVDDEAGLLRLFSFLLMRQGYEVLKAENGIAALEVLEKTVPNLMILDMVMPGLSGQEVLASVATMKRLDSMRIMILTAHKVSNFPENLTARIALWVSKPVSPQEFLSDVQQVLSDLN